MLCPTARITSASAVETSTFIPPGNAARGSDSSLKGITKNFVVALQELL
jgi:hypothetical protein